MGKLVWLLIAVCFVQTSFTQFQGIQPSRQFTQRHISAGEFTLEDIQKQVSRLEIEGTSSLHPIVRGGGQSGTKSGDIVYCPNPENDNKFLAVDMSEEECLLLRESTTHVGGKGVQNLLSVRLPGIHWRPHVATKDDVHFYLFTKTNPHHGIELFNYKTNHLASSKFWKKEAPVKILCHGYQSSSENRFPLLMKNSYLKLSEDLNVILVDWSGLARNVQYFTTAKETTGVGGQVALLIEQLLAEGVTSLTKIHFIGHSLGAHVGGATGYTLETVKKIGKIARITGLDPAGPGFCNNNIGQLQISDAEFVDVIHTDNSKSCESWWQWATNLLHGKWGSSNTWGHSNFFPNGGNSQPGCGIGFTCSHSRAYYYMEESFNMSSRAPVFKGCPCNSYDDFISRQCTCHSDESTVPMGEYTPITTMKGMYFLRTGRQYPYSIVKD